MAIVTTTLEATVTITQEKYTPEVITIKLDFKK